MFTMSLLIAELLVKTTMQVPAQLMVNPVINSWHLHHCEIFAPVCGLFSQATPSAKGVACVTSSVDNNIQLSEFC